MIFRSKPIPYQSSVLQFPATPILQVLTKPCPHPGSSLLSYSTSNSEVSLVSSTFKLHLRTDQFLPALLLPPGQRQLHLSHGLFQFISTLISFSMCLLPQSLRLGYTTATTLSKIWCPLSLCVYIGMHTYIQYVYICNTLNICKYT